MDADGKGEESMMDVNVNGRDVNVRLRDDVWAMEEPGTICLTLEQAYYLRRELNELSVAYLVDEVEEDG
jgi:hypothetical protein